MFRELTDIYDSWDSVIGQIDYFGDDPGNFSAVAGPGAWNDPDQVERIHFLFFISPNPFTFVYILSSSVENSKSHR